VSRPADRRWVMRIVDARGSNGNGACAVSVPIAARVTGTEQLSECGTAGACKQPRITFPRSRKSDYDIWAGPPWPLPVSTLPNTWSTVGYFRVPVVAAASTAGFSIAAVVRCSGGISSAAAAPMATVIAPIVSAGTNPSTNALTRLRAADRR
jgi:hypothetical protein